MPSTVSLVCDGDRRSNLESALTAVEADVAAALPDDPSDADVLLKPNLVKPRQLACTHVDAVDAVMDFLEDLGVDSFTVAESSAGDTEAVFEQFDYPSLRDDHDVDLVALEDEPYREVTLDYDPHPLTVRVAERLLDDSTFLVSLAKPKTHDTVVATLSLKNVLMGSILKTEAFDDKRKMHQGYEEINYYLALLAERVFPDVAIIDGYRGMEGNGPVHGDPVEHELAVASTDPLAADYVGLRCMGVDPDDVGYLTYVAEKGTGAYGDDAVDVRGDEIAACAAEYRLHETAEEQLSWKP